MKIKYPLTYQDLLDLLNYVVFNDIFLVIVNEEILVEEQNE